MFIRTYLWTTVNRRGIPTRTTRGKILRRLRHPKTGSHGRGTWWWIFPDHLLDIIDSVEGSRRRRHIAFAGVDLPKWQLFKPVARALGLVNGHQLNSVSIIDPADQLALSDGRIEKFAGISILALSSSVCRCLTRAPLGYFAGMNFSGAIRKARLSDVASAVS